MRNNTFYNQSGIDERLSKISSKKGRQRLVAKLPEVLFITSYPPKECGIATYSQDLFKALYNKFGKSLSLKICAIETGVANHIYPEEVEHVLDSTDEMQFTELAHAINTNQNISLVLIQHEFGFFHQVGDHVFQQFLQQLNKPVAIVFHTVLAQPDDSLREKVKQIAAACELVIVMTRNSMKILSDDYDVLLHKINVIPHGTHLVRHSDKELLREKYNLTGRKVLSTFGLLSSGKGIETTLDALPEIIKSNPEVLFLIIGKTHPGVIASEGEKYREMLLEKIDALQLNNHVKFINRYLPLPDLLEYLQLTDIYLFTSKDPNQAVSGTFSYAMSCGCPIISTPIPHALEVLNSNTGIIIDFQNSTQLAESVNLLMSNESLRSVFSSNTLQRIVPTTWENSAIAHAKLFQKITPMSIGKNNNVWEGHFELRAKKYFFPLQYSLPDISLDHVKKMTTDFGMIQFSKINTPDPDSGYTLDDNARGLIALCMHYELTKNDNDLALIGKYLSFIKYCQQPEGYFLNYLDSKEEFTQQNTTTNLADANGRAIWALGYLISRGSLFPVALITMAEKIMERARPLVETVHSTRAMAFAIKGLYYYNLEKRSNVNSGLIKLLANRLVKMYKHESEPDWLWFESYLTYANGILPEAMLCAWLDTGQEIYKEVAKASFDFLLQLTFNKDGIEVISNKSWLHKNWAKTEFHEREKTIGGEQPIDVAYTIIALNRFEKAFKGEGYFTKMTTAFNWFLGKNQLNQIIYNPCTGGCYDGLEENGVNLNQGAESVLSYLMARLTMEKQLKLRKQSSVLPKRVFVAMYS